MQCLHKTFIRARGRGREDTPFAKSTTVRADSAEGFDKGKLNNGVLEPLRESDLIK
jgi:hypothetical protein